MHIKKNSLAKLQVGRPKFHHNSNLDIQQNGLPRQASILQGINSIPDPMQAVPPLVGAGSEQERVLGWVPSPQVWEQDPLVHSLQPPLTR